MEKGKIVKLIIGILSILVGVIMFISNNSIIIPLLIAIGIMLIVFGVYRIVLSFGVGGPGAPIGSFILPSGIFSLLFGFILALNPAFILTFLNVFLSIFLIIYGVSKIITNYNFKKFGLKASWVTYVIAGVWIALGILIMATPWFTTLTIDIFLAIVLILFGINLLLSLKDKTPRKPNDKIVIDA